MELLFERKLVNIPCKVDFKHLVNFFKKMATNIDTADDKQ